MHVPESLIIIIFIIGVFSCFYYAFLACRYIVNIATRDKCDQVNSDTQYPQQLSCVSGVNDANSLVKND